MNANRTDTCCQSCSYLLAVIAGSAMLMGAGCGPTPPAETPTWARNSGYTLRGTTHGELKDFCGDFRPDQVRNEGVFGIYLNDIEYNAGTILKASVVGSGNQLPISKLTKDEGYAGLYHGPRVPSQQLENLAHSGESFWWIDKDEFLEEVRPSLSKSKVRIAVVVGAGPDVTNPVPNTAEIRFWTESRKPEDPSKKRSQNLVIPLRRYRHFVRNLNYSSGNVMGSGLGARRDIEFTWDAGHYDKLELKIDSGRPHDVTGRSNFSNPASLSAYNTYECTITAKLRGCPHETDRIRIEAVLPFPGSHPYEN